MFNKELFANTIDELQQAKTLWLAYSGGIDSSVLLHFFAGISEFRQKITIVHVNHGLSSKADAWEGFCRSEVQSLKLPYHSLKVCVNAGKGESLEAIARQARYKALGELMMPGDCLITAHHQDDQAETLLLQLLRGAGPKGMAAMPMTDSFSKGYIYRPFLTISRKELESYAQEFGLKWIDDESNEDTRFSRNFLRHDVMPLLKKRWPGLNNCLARSASLCADADDLVDDLAAIDYAFVRDANTAAMNTLSISALLTLSTARQSNVIRYWIASLNYPLPNQARLRSIIHDVLFSKQDATPSVSWGGVVVRRFQNRLYLESDLPAFDPGIELLWDLIKPLVLPNNMGTLQAKQVEGHGIRLPEQAQLTVKFRRGGERFHPRGRQGSHPLKNLFQEWQVPPWLRDRIPLIYSNDELIGVVGYAIAEGAYIKERGHEIIFSKSR